LMQKVFNPSPFDRSFHGEAKADRHQDLCLKSVLPFFLYPVLPSR